MTLRDSILALIDRKMLILAELEAINDELTAAYVVLGEIPSIITRKPTNPAWPGPILPPVIALAPGTKVCARCAMVQPMRPRQRYCDDCKRKRSAEAAAAWRREHPGYNHKHRQPQRPRRPALVAAGEAS